MASPTGALLKEPPRTVVSADPPRPSSGLALAPPPYGVDFVDGGQGASRTGPAVAAAPAAESQQKPAAAGSKPATTGVEAAAEQQVAETIRARPGGMLVCLSIPDAFTSKEEAALEGTDDPRAEQVAKWLDSDKYPWKTVWAGEEHEADFRQAKLAALRAQVAEATKALAASKGDDRDAARARVQAAAAQQAQVARLPAKYGDGTSAQKAAIRGLIRGDAAARDRVHAIAYDNNSVFSKGARSLAKDRGAVAVREGQVVVGEAMTYEAPGDIPRRVREVHDEVKALLLRRPARPGSAPAASEAADATAAAQAAERAARIRHLALFAHGTSSWLGGEGHATDASFSKGAVDDLVGKMHDVTTQDIRMILFACSAAKGPVDDAKSRGQIKVEARTLAAKLAKAQEQIAAEEEQLAALAAELAGLKQQIAAAPPADGSTKKKRGKPPPSPESLRVKAIEAEVRAIDRKLRPQRKEAAKLTEKRDANATWQEWARYDGGGSIAATFLESFAARGHKDASIVGHLVAGPAIRNYQLRFLHAHAEGEAPRTSHEWRPPDVFTPDFLADEAQRLVPGPGQALSRAGLELAVEVYAGTVGGKGAKPRNFGGGAFSKDMNEFLMREAWMEDLSSIEALRAAAHATFRAGLSQSEVRKYVAEVVARAKKAKITLFDAP